MSAEWRVSRGRRLVSTKFQNRWTAAVRYGGRMSADSRARGSRQRMVALASLAVIALSPAFGSETINYTYDARGRLVKVAHSGTVNNGVTANYSYDDADNRSNVTVTGAGGGGTTPSFSASNASATEGANLVFTVTMSGSASSSFTVNYATANGTAGASDYTAKSGTLTFTAAQTSLTVSVATTDDTTVESAETVMLNLSNAGAGSTISDAQGVGTINDNDSAGNSPPTAVNDTGTVAQCETDIFNVTANDTDSDGDYPLAVTAVTGAGFSVASSTSIQFTATISTGAKVGTYTVKDSLGAQDTGTLTVTVTTGGSCGSLLSAPETPGMESTAPDTPPTGDSTTTETPSTGESTTSDTPATQDPAASETPPPEPTAPDTPPTGISTTTNEQVEPPPEN